MSEQAQVAGRVARSAESSFPFNLGGVVSVGLLHGLVYSSMHLSLSDNPPQDDVTSNILADAQAWLCKRRSMSGCSGRFSA